MSDEPSFLGISNRVWDGITGLIAVLSTIAVAGGLWLALIEYWEAKRIAKVNATLDMIAKWDNGKLGDAWFCLETSIDIELKGREAEVARASARMQEGVEGAFEELYGAIANEILSRDLRCTDRYGNPSLKPSVAFQLVLDHMREFSICLESGICETSTGVAYYAETVDDLTVIFEKPLRTLAEDSPRDVSGLYRLRDLFASTSIE